MYLAAVIRLETYKLGSQVVAPSGTANLSVPSPSLVASGNMRPAGSATLNTQDAQLVASGISGFEGVANLDVPSVELNAVGYMRPAGQANLQVSSAILIAAGAGGAVAELARYAGLLANVSKLKGR